MKAERYLSPKQAAEAIGASESSLKRWCDKGLLSMTKTAGGHRRIPVAELLEFSRAHGHQLTRPELLGLPRGTAGPRDYQEAVRALANALQHGHGGAVEQIALSLLAAGTTVIDACDRLIAPAVAAVRDARSRGELPLFCERRALALADGLVHRLSQFTAEATKGHRALCSGIRDAADSTALNLLWVGLRALGFQVEHLGNHNAVDTVCVALAELRPSIVAVASDGSPWSERRTDRFVRLADCAARLAVPMVIVGNGIDPNARVRLRYATCIHSLSELSSFVDTVVSKSHRLMH